MCVCVGVSVYKYMCISTCIYKKYIYFLSIKLPILAQCTLKIKTPYRIMMNLTKILIREKRVHSSFLLTTVDWELIEENLLC